MRFWLDAQLPPSLCDWLSTKFGIEAEPVRSVGLRDAEDEEVFAAARLAGVVVMSKDADFGRLVERHGPVDLVTEGELSPYIRDEILLHASTVYGEGG